jgi:hypothetical protein
MAINIDIPAQYNTYHEKWAWIYTLGEQMTQLYTEVQSWHTVGGYTLTQYNNLPSWIKDVVAYHAKLNDNQYGRVVKRITAISDKINKRRAILRQNVYDANMDCVLDRDITVT